MWLFLLKTMHNYNKSCSTWESFCFINDLAVNTNKSKVMLCGPVKGRNGFQIEYKRKKMEIVK